MKLGSEEAEASHRFGSWPLASVYTLYEYQTISLAVYSLLFLHLHHPYPSQFIDRITGSFVLRI
jgi:hypothetical protein